MRRSWWVGTVCGGCAVSDLNIVSTESVKQRVPTHSKLTDFNFIRRKLMAIYRNVMMNFWTDRKVADDFTPEDRYFYLYLFTNPHTNLCGCYEISIKQTIAETGYSRDSIENLLKRFEEVHDVIRYSSKTGEVLILNWHKYNWTSSEKFRKPLLDQIKSIKSPDFKSYLLMVFESENDTISIPYGYGIDTTDTVTDTVTVSDTVKDKKKKTEKIAYGEFNNVMLTDEEYAKIIDRWPKDYNEKIENLSTYISKTGK